LRTGVFLTPFGNLDKKQATVLYIQKTGIFEFDIMIPEREDLVEYLARLFFQRIMQELDTFDAAGLHVDRNLLHNFNISLKEQMLDQTVLADQEIVEEAIDKAFNEIARIREPKH